MWTNGFFLEGDREEKEPWTNIWIRLLFLIFSKNKNREKLIPVLPVLFLIYFTIFLLCSLHSHILDPGWEKTRLLSFILIHHVFQLYQTGRIPNTSQAIKWKDRVYFAWNLVSLGKRQSLFCMKLKMQRDLTSWMRNLFLLQYRSLIYHLVGCVCGVTIRAELTFLAFFSLYWKVSIAVHWEKPKA